MNTQRHIVPPEMAALLLPVKGIGKVKGYMFRRGCDGLWHSKAGYITILREDAHVYSWREVVQACRNPWNWGHRRAGHWVVAYV